jgi:hypothetical protein
MQLPGGLDLPSAGHDGGGSVTETASLFAASTLVVVNRSLLGSAIHCLGFEAGQRVYCGSLQFVPCQGDGVFLFDSLIIWEKTRFRSPAEDLSASLTDQVPKVATVPITATLSSSECTLRLMPDPQPSGLKHGPASDGIQRKQSRTRCSARPRVGQRGSRRNAKCAQGH